MAHLSRSTQVDFVDFGPFCAEGQLWRVATSILPHRRRSMVSRYCQIPTEGSFILV